MASPEEIAVLLDRNAHPDGRELTQHEREELLKPYMPAPRDRASQNADRSIISNSIRSSGAQVRHLFAVLLYRFCFNLIQFVFSIYMRIRQGYHSLHHRLSAVLFYHHRTPELIRRDIKGLSRLPKHLSVIVGLDVDIGGEGYAHALSKLVADVAELVAWCTCAGIPTLSIYERSGVLKSHIPALHSAIAHTLRAYYTSDSVPPYNVRAPNQPSYSPPNTPSADPQQLPIRILLLSEVDGRATLVDLTKTLVDMTQKGKIRPSEVTMDLIDVEVTEGTCGEPDLLVVMAPSERKRKSKKVKRKRSRITSEPDVNGVIPATGDDFVGRQPGGEVCLRGYPPWHIRLTEIHHAPDNSGIEYQVFLKALYNFARAQMRWGR